MSKGLEFSVASDDVIGGCPTVQMTRDVAGVITSMDEGIYRAARLEARRAGWIALDQLDPPHRPAGCGRRMDGHDHFTGPSRYLAWAVQDSAGLLEVGRDREQLPRWRRSQGHQLDEGGEPGAGEPRRTVPGSWRAPHAVVRCPAGRNLPGRSRWPRHLDEQELPSDRGRAPLKVPSTLKWQPYATRTDRPWRRLWP